MAQRQEMPWNPRNAESGQKELVFSVSLWLVVDQKRNSRVILTTNARFLRAMRPRDGSSG